MNRKRFLIQSILTLSGWPILSAIQAPKQMPQSYADSLRRQSLPVLFLIGDSISIQYTPHLKQYLQKLAILDRKQDHAQAELNRDMPAGPNGGDSEMVRAYLESKLNDNSFCPDYILLNCGLHDIKRSGDGSPQISPDDYRIHLQSIVNMTKNHNIDLIWIRTTPVIDEVHNSRTSSFKRYGEDVKQYNRIADKVCSEHEIPAIDLFGFTQKLGRDAYKDHVHYTEPARKLQAAYIAGAVQTLISS